MVFAGLIVLSVVHAVPRSEARPRTATPATTLRVVLYETAPAEAVAGRPAAVGSGGAGARVRSQLAALAWADADAALVHWGGPSTIGDQKLAAVLAGIRSARAEVRAAALIEGRSSALRLQLRSLAKLRARSPGYLHIRSRPVVFVAPGEQSRRSCAQARRVRAAARGFWLSQAAFAGYARCLSAADAWFQDAPVTRTARARGSFLIRPGYWASSARSPRITRSIADWRRSIQQMVSSRAPLEVIDSLNDWSHGTAIGASPAWASASGFGLYLDALHQATRGVPATPALQAPAGPLPSVVPLSVTPPAVTPPLVTPPAVTSPTVTPPTVEAAGVSAVKAHEATISAGVSAGAAAATWWVEYGATTAYGQATTPASLAAGSPKRTVSLILAPLSAAAQYHAQVVVSSSLVRVVSPDIAFTTLADAQVARVAAAGDIACPQTDLDFNAGLGTATTCRQMAVSDGILAGGYSAVLPLGDEQYNAGTAATFNAAYRPSWGRLDSIAHPAVGNHEYGSPGAAPYFNYFGASAGRAGQGWYSYEIGSWHVIALNSNCALVGGCGTGSSQETWLRADLAGHPARCTLAYWHHPLFSSGQEGPTAEMSTIWADLASAGADLVLNGHDHDYERFAPQSATGLRDTANGMREFIVGTGGRNHMSLHKVRASNSEVGDSSSFGFLELTLHSAGYDWRFVAAAPDAFSDSGTTSCH
jgi:hypothetical protein